MLETRPAAGSAKVAPYDKHSLRAAMRRIGGKVATISGSAISENDTILIRASAQDEESGIKMLRVAGSSKICQQDSPGGFPRPLDYQAPRVWAVKDFAPGGKGRIPKAAVTEAEVSVAELMRAAPHGRAGIHASFQFYVEATNGAGLQSSTQWLEYRVGTIACP
jgi:hypothetical protein